MGEEGEGTCLSGVSGNSEIDNMQQSRVLTEDGETNRPLGDGPRDIVLVLVQRQENNEESQHGYAKDALRSKRELINELLLIAHPKLGGVAYGGVIHDVLLSQKSGDCGKENPRSKESCSEWVDL